MSKADNKKQWPENAVWPKPILPSEGITWEEDMIDPFTVDEEVSRLLKIKQYYDGLREDGLLDEDYHRNEDYDFEEDEEDWEPAIGEDYWDEDAFDLDRWQMELDEAMNSLKIECTSDITKDPVIDIHRIIGYQFTNENLLRQAFTRRSFAVEYGIDGYAAKYKPILPGCNEQLEFLGDSILNMAVTKEIMQLYAELDADNTDAPYIAKQDEGVLTNMKKHFISKEYLSARAEILGLDKYILYGSTEQESDSAKEDTIEALIGAVAIDSSWDMDVLDKLIDTLIDLHIDYPDNFIRKSYYDLLNTWHQKHFNCTPSYDVYKSNNRYSALLRYFIPNNDNGICTERIVLAEGTTRSGAREEAARKAYFFINNCGLWTNLKEAGITPDLTNSVNQLQELYQKKYISELPVYEFSEEPDGLWHCDCFFDSFHGYGKGTSKIKAKKEAAYLGLQRLFASGGMNKTEQ